MPRFEFGGPPRFAHQKRGLAKLIACNGVGALLMEPGTGKRWHRPAGRRASS